MLLHTAHLAHFLDISHVSIPTLCTDLSRIGLEVEGAHPFDLSEKVVVAKVLSKAKHPNAEKLSVCQVDSGNGVLQIVCGAKNVEAGQFVALALEGAHLSACDLAIKPSTLRGVESFGMLCSALELGLPKLEEGILVLDRSINADKPLKLGTPLKELPFFQGTLLDIGLTPNRGDCASVLGVAREIAALYGLKPNTPSTKAPTNKPALKLEKSTKHLALAYAHFNVPSLNLSLEMRLTLALQNSLGKDPLDNLLAYVTHLSGVILHAYPTTELEIKEDKLGFVKAYSQDTELSNIAFNPPKNMGLNALIEASFLDPNYVATRLSTHAPKHAPSLTQRTTRGSEPQVLLGLALLQEALTTLNAPALEWESFYSGLEAKRIEFGLTDIVRLLGLEISSAKVHGILEGLGFGVQVTDGHFSVQVPLFRHDIADIADIAEEVLRFVGIENIPSALLDLNEQTSHNPHYTRHCFERTLATKALSLGFKEVVHYLFAKKETLEKLGYPTLKDSLDLQNPINSDFNTLRTSLIPGLLQAVAHNKNLGFRGVALFELGSVYSANREEAQSLAFIASGLKDLPHYPHPKGTQWDFYNFATNLSQILGSFCLQSISPTEQEAQPYLSTAYHPHASAWIVVGGQKVGVIGAINPILVQEGDLLAGFMAEVQGNALSPKPYKAKEFFKLPTSFRDLTLILDKDCPFNALQEALFEANIPHLQEVIALDLYPENANQIALSVRLKIQSNTALTDHELQEVVQEALSVLETRLGAKLK
ncbi:Phenylalanyl-tRNA synthetase subunit beta PheT [Helicobacter sp. NHP21005]|uniref:YtpR family tRNA-binding protein n=1 Tax=Helicobacter felistomachi TaxID=3040201 RepID=UPI002573C819|nr:phenylalanine--tRNA ligase subunit beta [Helicobacter sp. NHP21005]BEG57143.1 Phenylalanyl-tRNA synthetase subunit beta PheT [Helicobacter sp. NHP21005]